MTNFEMVEKLRQTADVSYEEAQDALEKSSWDLLDAVLLLEREGKIPLTGGSYSTRAEKAEPEAEPDGHRGPGELRRFFRWLGKTLRKLIRIGNTTNRDFTQRELEILKELTSGDSNTVIADRLHISVGTVKSHIQHLLEKTGFRTRTELVSEACSLGIVVRNTIRE